MESDDDFELLSSAAAATSPPAPERKLKRLKKASSISVSVPLSEPPAIELTNPNPSSPQSDPGSSDLHEPSPSWDEPLGSLSLERKNEDEIVVGAGKGGLGVKRALDFDSSAIDVADEELRDGNEDLQRSDTALEKDGGDLREGGEGLLDSETAVEKAGDQFGKEGEEDSREDEEEENHKKRSVSSFLEEDGDGSSKKKTKKDKKNEKLRGDYDDGTPDGDEKVEVEAPAGKRVNRRSEERERRTHLKQLHVDSQRILRETRDASFKPIPIVHKPISSVLEKIRQRKLEISKKYASVSSFAYGDFDSPEDDVELDMKGDSLTKDLRVDGVERVGVEKTKMDPVEALNGVEGVHKDGSNDCAAPSSAEKVSSLKLQASHEDSKQEFRAPIDDTQDLFSDSQTNSPKQESLSGPPSSPLEEGFAPSLLAMNLKLDSVPADDLSEHDEEDNDKENVDPRLGQAINFTLSPKGDHLKNFLDDEAEEEDDSDNDPMRSQEIEEEDDMEDAEELNQMIATNFKETDTDRDKRNQLHQKWLEQQDAAGTEHLLQRLNVGSNQREANLLQDEEDEEEREVEEEEKEVEAEELSDGDAEDEAPANSARINLRRIKQMIPQMFTDKDDPYVSSDDEESERRHTKQSLCEKFQGKPTLLSPAEDESTRDAFQLIKKLNIPRETKKRAKPPTHYSMLLSGGKMNGLEKSSFLGRASSSQPSSKSNKTSTTRSFVFGRDDSNSRGATLASEDPPETIEEESRPTKAPSAKFSNSQSKISTQTRTTAEVKQSSSLYDILRRPSMKSEQCVRETIVDRTESIFAAFRLEKSSRNGRVLS